MEGPKLGAACLAAGTVQQEPDGGGQLGTRAHVLRRDASSFVRVVLAALRAH
ncbi:hypothetical protein [Actinoplanes derwentensis]|uniref:hypothetical protein n=1 Tax=Actinoplanes derwentensis TaxID=113562 RepID=UPI0012FE2680|nr:hypothetical protein [Actinoplanes derwentensis]